MATVYITGASAGLGRAIAHAYSGAGHTVGLIARDADALRETVAELNGPAAFATADVADYDALDEAAQSLERALGPPDIWINDAMATIFARFEDIPQAEFARAMNVTFLGSVHGMQIALKYMKPRRRGHIIQVGSALAYRAIPLQAPYCAAKHALRGACDSLRCELLHDRLPIRVTMVHMPAMNTPQFDWARRHIAQHQQPVKPIYTPASCARAVLWAATHAHKREIWVGAPTMQAILANKLVPAIMDRYMASRAFEGQFEKPAAEKNTAGNLDATVPSLHATNGHFGDMSRTSAWWISTSYAQELIMLALAFVMLAAASFLIVRGIFG